MDTMEYFFGRLIIFKTAGDENGVPCFVENHLKLK